MCGCWWPCRQWLSRRVNHSGLGWPRSETGEACWNSEEGCRMAPTWPLTLHLGFISARVEVQPLWDALIICPAPFSASGACEREEMVQKYSRALMWNLCAYLVVCVHAVGRLDGALEWTEDYSVEMVEQSDATDPSFGLKVMYVLWMLVWNGKYIHNKAAVNVPLSIWDIPPKSNTTLQRTG